MPNLENLQDIIFWSYANLSMAHAALDSEATSFGPREYSIRSSMWRRLCEKDAEIRPLIDDEKQKMKRQSACAYCGSSEELTADHLLPTSRGGPESGANLVRACRSCNSSKNNRDLMSWFAARDEFPPILLLRRYLKSVYIYAEDHDLLDMAPDTLNDEELPFDIEAIPRKVPHLNELDFWVDLA